MDDGVGSRPGEAILRPLASITYHGRVNRPIGVVHGIGFETGLRWPTLNRLVTMFRLTILLGVLLACGTGTAQSRDYRPWIDEVLLSRCRSIVVARLDRVTVMPSRERLARFHVKELLKGSEGETVLVIGAGDATDSFRKLDKILFLERTGGETMRVLVDLVDLPSQDGRARLSFVRRMLEASKRRQRTRVADVKRLVLDHVTSGSPWVRRVLIREIDQLVRRVPGCWRSADIEKIELLRADDLGETETRRLRAAKLAIEEETATRWTRSQLVFPDEATRKSFLADLDTFERTQDSAVRVAFLDAAAKTFGRRLAPLLVRHVRDRDDEVAERCADLLGEMESGAGVTPLINVLRSRRPSTVRRAAATALGKIGSPKGVPPLVALAQRDSELLRDVLRALATTGVGDAMLWLRDYDAKLRRDAESDPELRRLVTHLLSDTFRDECGAAHAARRKRWLRPPPKK